MMVEFCIMGLCTLIAHDLGEGGNACGVEADVGDWVVVIGAGEKGLHQGN